MIYLNGNYMPIEEAKISVLDRGFIFGDGIYEVIPVYSHKPFRLEEHLARLRHSLASVRMDNPHTDTEWEQLIKAIITGNGWEDQYVYLQITRGVAKRDHALPAGLAPTVFIMSTQLTPPPAELREQGMTAVTAVDYRWHRCDIKSTSLLANVLLRQLAVDEGCQETVLLRDGFLSEGAASNIFVVKDGVLLAPPKSNLMLPGITYDVVLELAVAAGLPHEVGPVAEATVRSADELWMTNSTREVLPITRLDGQPVGNGRPGPMFRQMNGLYQDFKTQVMRA
jgi:D-alanine transaminase